MFKLFSDTEKDDILLAGAKFAETGAGAGSQSGFVALYERACCNDAVAENIRKNILILLGRPSVDSTLSREETERLKQAADFVYSRGGFTDFGNTVTEFRNNEKGCLIADTRKSFKNNFLKYEPMEQSFLNLVNNQFKIEDFLVRAVRQIAAGKKNQPIGAPDVNAWRTSADFWLNELIKQNTALGKSGGSFGQNVLDAMESKTRSKLHPMDVLVACKYLIAGMIEKKLISPEQVRQKINTWIVKDSGEVVLTGTRLGDQVLEYKEWIDRQLLLSVSGVSGLRKAPQVAL